MKLGKLFFDDQSSSLDLWPYLSSKGPSAMCACDGCKWYGFQTGTDIASNEDNGLQEVPAVCLVPFSSSSPCFYVVPADYCPNQNKVIMEASSPGRQAVRQSWSGFLIKDDSVNQRDKVCLEQGGEDSKGRGKWYVSLVVLGMRLPINLLFSTPTKMTGCDSTLGLTYV